MSDVIVRLKKRLQYNLNPIARKDYEYAIEELTTLTKENEELREEMEVRKAHIVLLGHDSLERDRLRTALEEIGSRGCEDCGHEGSLMCSPCTATAVLDRSTSDTVAECGTCGGDNYYCSVCKGGYHGCRPVPAVDPLVKCKICHDRGGWDCFCGPLPDYHGCPDCQVSEVE